MRDVVYKMITDTVENTEDSLIGDDQSKDEWDFKGLNDALRPIVPVELITPNRVTGNKKDELKHQLKQQAVKL